MAFDLNITFVGLCLYLEDSGMVHVLLLSPEEGGHGHHAVERHYARLRYDTAYEDRAVTPRTRRTSISLDDKLLDLRRFVGESPSISVNSTHLPNVSELAGKLVKRDYIGATPGPRVAARVTLADGTMVVPAGGASGPWAFTDPSEHLRIAFRITFEIKGIQQAELNWTLDELNGMGHQALRPLRPYEGGPNVIDVEIVNVPYSELKPDNKPTNAPQFGQPAAHFAGYYSIFGKVAKKLLPIWMGKTHHIGTNDDAAIASPFWSDAYSCGKAMAQLEAPHAAGAGEPVRPHEHPAPSR